MKIKRVDHFQLDDLVDLFDEYRQNEGQPPAPAACRDYLKARIDAVEGVFFLATSDEGGKGVGFVTLYPSFSSVSLRRIWILNDLFVTRKRRAEGVGSALLSAAREFALGTAAKRIELKALIENEGACRLYERHGYKRNAVDSFYVIDLDQNSTSPA